MKLKKLLGTVLLGSMVFSLAACGGAANNSAQDTEIKTIGISQYGEHGSLDNCRIGFLQGLENAGLKEGVDYEIDYQNAGFDDAIAIQIAQSFSANDVDLMCAIATPSATACFSAAEDKDIPVIFTAITDPVQAGLDSGNITGTSDKLPVSAQLELIRRIQPEAKTIGIIYTTSEPNSVSAIAEYQALAGDYGFAIEAVGVTAQAEVALAVDNILGKVDCLSNLTDNNVVGVLDSVLEKCDNAGIPVYGSEVEQVKKGCLAAAGIDYISLGQQTGEMAAKILRGEATCEEIPYETIAEYGIYLNTDTAERLNVALEDDLVASAITEFE